MVLIGVNNRSSIHPRYQRHAVTPLGGFKDAVIQIIDPNTAQQAAEFDIYNNTSDFATVEVLWQGDAQMAVFRQTLNAPMPVGAVTQIRSIRFLCDLNGPQIPIRKGLQVVVVSCEGDPQAMLYQYTITSGLGGGLGFQRAIEAEADMGVVLSPPIT